MHRKTHSVRYRSKTARCLGSDVGGAISTEVALLMAASLAAALVVRRRPWPASRRDSAFGVRISFGFRSSDFGFYFHACTSKLVMKSAGLVPAGRCSTIFR